MSCSVLSFSNIVVCVAYVHIYDVRKLNHKIVYSTTSAHKTFQRENKTMYSLFGDSENRGKNYLKIRDLLSIALFNILGTHYSIHIRVKVVKEKIQIIKKISIGPNTNFIRL